MDPIADLLTSIRNANQALKTEIIVPHSKIKESAVKLLKEEGYLESFNVEGDVKRTLRIGLKFQGRKGVITDLQRVSRPGLRRYTSSKEIPMVLGGMGIAVVSTPQGLMTGDDARRQNVGGELLFKVW
ncbi:MAG: 30S ribosomal protein S8 [Opitutia bacterium TMED102]|nr:30S ribosomal protein S8 [Verrucomicrobiales bacterium]OUV43185.1 MAG: 30S ribosomal protein S8 [Opitutae bacterium TMED102]